MAISTQIMRYELAAEAGGEGLAAMAAEALAALPAWRRATAEKFRLPRDRFLSAKAYLLLEEGLRNAGIPFRELRFEATPSGKPLLMLDRVLRDDIHFNISHCNKCVCVAIAPEPVGIDVEEIQYDPDLAREVLNGEELKRVAEAESPEVEFTRLWTAKESYLKMTGEGLRDDLRDVLRDLAGPDAPAVQATEVHPAYVLTLTVAKPHDSSAICRIEPAKPRVRSAKCRTKTGKPA